MLIVDQNGANLENIYKQSSLSNQKQVVTINKFQENDRYGHFSTKVGYERNVNNAHIRTYGWTNRSELIGSARFRGNQKSHIQRDHRIVRHSQRKLKNLHQAKNCGLKKAIQQCQKLSGHNFGYKQGFHSFITRDIYRPLKCVLNSAKPRFSSQIIIFVRYCQLIVQRCK